MSVDFGYFIGDVCLQRGLADFWNRKQVASVMDVTSGAYAAFYASGMLASGIYSTCFGSDPGPALCSTRAYIWRAEEHNLNSTETKHYVDYALALDVTGHMLGQLRTILIDIAAHAVHGAVILLAAPYFATSVNFLVRKLRGYAFSLDVASTAELRQSISEPGCCCPPAAHSLLVFHRDIWLPSRSASLQGDDSIAVYFINAEVDKKRRIEILEMCAELQFDCQRIVPPPIGDPEVKACSTAADLRPWECSLSYAHMQILSTVAASSHRAAIFEDDARLNPGLTPHAARRIIADIRDDFVMGGWCQPSCSHAYFVSPYGAAELLARGFHNPRKASDKMFAHFKTKHLWPEVEAAGGKLLYPEVCPHGFEFDVGMFCQDRTHAHSAAYFIELCQLEQRQ